MVSQNMQKFILIFVINQSLKDDMTQVDLFFKQSTKVKSTKKSSTLLIISA